MNPVGRQHRNTPESLIQEFLDNGGKVQQFDYGERSENLEYPKSFYGKRKKATKNEDAPKED
tara:strand:+ start:58 stop:243 length:186 start_codon:yes stop_codon:yes gene_type:complete